MATEFQFGFQALIERLEKTLDSYTINTASWPNSI